MESLYAIVGMSRQAYHQGLQRAQEVTHQAEEIYQEVQAWRKDHPRMGARLLYQQLRQAPDKQELLEGIGRDKFEQLLFEGGFKLRKSQAKHRTTYSVRARYPNLIAGREVQQINLIWMSDITYFRIWDRFVYLTNIIDLYSRRCLGVVWGKTLEAESTVIPAIQMAFNSRKGHTLSQCIFHSDAGGQYVDAHFLQLIQQQQIRLSMARSCYENPFIEKFHDILKNQYLIPWGVDSERQLDGALKRFIHLYNFHRPHGSLDGLTPAAFEEIALKMPEKKRKIMYIKPLS